MKPVIYIYYVISRLQNENAMKEKFVLNYFFFLSLQFLRVIRGASLVQWFPNLTGTGHLESLYVGCFKAGS